MLKLIGMLGGRKKLSDAERIVRERSEREAAFQKEIETSPFGRAKAPEVIQRWEERTAVAGAVERMGRPERAETSSPPPAKQGARRWTKATGSRG